MEDTRPTTDIKHKVAVSKQFFMMIPVKYIGPIIKNCLQGVSYEESCQIQDEIASATFLHPVAKSFPPSVDYLRLFTKTLISEIESQNQEVIEEIYTFYTSLLSTSSSDKECYVTYSLPDDLTVTLRTTKNLVTEGTTGMCVWEASYVLAEFCLRNKDIFSKKSILELGCGLGLTSLAVVQSCQPSSYTITDHHPLVLKTVVHNISLNLKSNVSLSEQNDRSHLKWNDTSIIIERLDWGDESSSIPQCDIVLAADVIYDQTIIPVFLNTLSRSLTGPSSVTFVASTIRNQETFDAFTSALDNYNLIIKDESIIMHQPLQTQPEVKVVIYKICRKRP